MRSQGADKRQRRRETDRKRRRERDRKRGGERDRKRQPTEEREWEGYKGIIHNMSI